MQQVGGMGFGDILKTYGGVEGLNPPYIDIVCHGDLV
jgi:hypothetical protein